jgi:site-specific recombinase XerC
MTVHRKGAKADRDRAVLINSYHVMCHDFRIPKKDRLDAAAIARLSNEMLLKVNKDMYSQATVKQARKLAIKMGLDESNLQRRIRRIRSWFHYLFHKPKIIRPNIDFAELPKSIKKAAHG